MFSKLSKLFWQMVSYFRRDEAGASEHAGVFQQEKPQPEQVQVHEKEPEARSEAQAQQAETADHDAGDAPAVASAPGAPAGGDLASASVAQAPSDLAANRDMGAETGENRQQRRARKARARLKAAPRDDEYRRLERARLKHDQWVTPAGQAPAERLRAAPQPDTAMDTSQLVEPVPAAPEVEDAHLWFADKLHYDEDVLVDESELYGTFNFRDTILDQLDRYWFYLERMRKKDPDSYGFYKQIGATLVPHVMPRVYESTGEKIRRSAEETAKARSEIRLPAQFRSDRPSFGCIVWGANSVVEQHENKLTSFYPRFMYFVKYNKAKMPPEIQPVAGDGDVYKMVVWFDSPTADKGYFKKSGFPCEFAVFVDRTGTDIRALRILDTKIVTIPKKHSAWETYRIPRRAWHIPEFYHDWAGEHGLSPALHLAWLFCDAMRQIERTNYAMLRVAVHKKTGNDDTVAVFGLEPARMSYFFRDRDYKLTASGHRKPIFHFVRPYVRADGTAVKAQFRGDKEFDWAGYHVSVTVPGLDHFMLPELSVGCEDEYWRQDSSKKEKERFLDQTDVAKKLVDWMQQGRGGYKARRAQ